MWSLQVVYGVDIVKDLTLLYKMQILEITLTDFRDIGNIFGFCDNVCPFFGIIFFSDIGDEGVLKTLWDRYEKATDKVFYFVFYFKFAKFTSFLL